MVLRTISNYLRPTRKVYQIVDRLAYHAKSLYNVGLYNARQYYATYQENLGVARSLRPDLVSQVEVWVGSYLPYTRKKAHPAKDLSNYALSKENENYRLLYSDAALQTLKSVDEAYRGYFQVFHLYQAGKVPYRPGPPRYLPKDGRFKVAYPRARLQFRGNTVTLGMSHAFRKQHGLTGRELTFPIPPCIKPHQIREVTLIPIHGGKVYKIEFTYEVQEQPADLDPNQYLAIDLGRDNFATIVETATGTATILDGKYLKSINRWYNKENARLQRIKDKQGLSGITKRQSGLLLRRDNRIEEALNRYVNWLVTFAMERRIGTVVLPRWDGIKDKINHGRKNNQNFVQIPFDRFRQKLAATCELVGIRFDDSHDEAYTSQVDALALDPIRKPPYGRKRRIKRGLYRSIMGTLINADVNSALNHVRNVAGDSVIPRIISSGRVNRPVRIRLAFEDPSEIDRQLSHALNWTDALSSHNMRRQSRDKPPVVTGGS
ncbi:MAG: transposase [Candidatus Methanomethylophilaceae archaeon]|nr:transposase [Candidatus Methanomethylophilaceae archaeon]